MRSITTTEKSVCSWDFSHSPDSYWDSVRNDEEYSWWFVAFVSASRQTPKQNTTSNIKHKFKRQAQEKLSLEVTIGDVGHKFHEFARTDAFWLLTNSNFRLLPTTRQPNNLITAGRRTKQRVLYHFKITVKLNLNCVIFAKTLNHEYPGFGFWWSRTCHFP